MKRPVLFVLVASLLIGGTALASEKSDRAALHKKIVPQVLRGDNNRGGDQRGNHGNDRRNDRGNSQRNDHNDRRGDRGNDRGNNQRNNDRRDNNNHAPPSFSRDDRRDHRRDDRRDNRRDDRHDGRHDSNDRRHDNRNDHRGNNHRDWNRHRNDWHNHPNYWDNRRHDRRDYALFRFHFGSYRAPHGYAYRVWHRGDRLPRHYYGHSYIIHDWHPYRLYAPPYGYHWVRVGNDVLLTAIATGVVLDVIYDIWY